MKEALKMALEALEVVNRIDLRQVNEAIAAIKEALANHIEDNLAMVAQPEQEPVGHRDGYWCDDLTCKKCYSADFRFKHKNSVDKECLTTSPQRKPLTDEQIEAIWRDGIYSEGLLYEFNLFARAIEAAHGIKE